MSVWLRPFISALERFEPDVYLIPHGYAGVTSQFLENAGEYDAKYTDYDHWRLLLENALSRLLDLGGRMEILDLGSGAGNSVVPVLEMFPEAHIVATDISPQLLSMLRRRLVERGLADRALLVSVDLCEDHLEPESFDLVVGGSILHHLLDPAALLRRVCSWLRPARYAVFFEPFALGSLFLALVYERLIAERAALGLSEQVVDLFRRIATDIRVRMARPPDVFPHLDDKWIFTPRFFEEAVSGLCEVRIDPINTAPEPLTHKTKQLLMTVLSAPESALPAPAWEVLRSSDAMLGDVRREAFMEACVTLRRP